MPGARGRRDLLSVRAARNAASNRRTKLPIAVEERVVLDAARPATCQALSARRCRFAGGLLSIAHKHCLVPITDDYRL